MSYKSAILLEPSHIHVRTYAMHRQYVSATFCSGARTVPAESSRRTGSRDGTSPLIRAHTSAQSRKVHSFIAMPADVNRAAARQRLLIRVAPNGCYQRARSAIFRRTAGRTETFTFVADINSSFVFRQCEFTETRQCDKTKSFSKARR